MNIQRRKLDFPLALLNKIGVFRAVQLLVPHSLTVLNYHRVENPFNKSFDTFKPNISATPENFERQMDYMRNHFNLISGRDLTSCLRGEREFPSHAAMITFDDGYYDNWEYAYPVLKARNIPATIFLTSNYIESNKMFYWDILAYAFHHTKKDNARFPLIGERQWREKFEKAEIISEWISAAKRLPDSEKENAVEAVPALLGVEIDEKKFKNFHLNWNQVREMAQNGIEMGSHTMSHPILTRISMKQVSDELLGSKQKIEMETGMAVTSFAYPNGGIGDFTPEISNLLHELGYDFAFTLFPGLNTYAAIKKNPYAIRRIFLSHTDTFSRFVAKVSWFSRRII